MNASNNYCKQKNKPRAMSSKSRAAQEESCDFYVYAPIFIPFFVLFNMGP